MRAKAFMMCIFLLISSIGAERRPTKQFTPSPASAMVIIRSQGSSLTRPAISMGSRPMEGMATTTTARSFNSLPRQAAGSTTFCINSNRLIPMGKTHRWSGHG